MVYFPRLHVRKVLFSTLWPSYSPFLGKSETKSREAVAGKEKATGKLTLGRTEGERPHRMSDRERSRRFLGWHSGTQASAGRYKKKEVSRGTRLHILSHFSAHSRPSRPLKGAPRVIARVIWLQTQLECRANCGLLNQPQLLI